jgi:predicted RNase H-like HicB family nuclease
LPIIIGKEGKWYVASCPILDIATQGKTEKEARENIEELIIEYLKDPDTPKPNLETFTFPSLSYIEVSIK